MPDRRLKAVWDVNVPVIRELAGVHEYDGVVMDLSPSGRQAALERLGPSSPGERLADRHDESHLSAAEQGAYAEAEAEILRWNPLPHIQNLDLSCYDREYAPEPQRRRAREAHLAGGKLEIMSLRDQALAAWGMKFSLRRFHEALLALGAPPLGTMGDALVA